jgi:hypothetical protein
MCSFNSINFSKILLTPTKTNFLATKSEQHWFIHTHAYTGPALAFDSRGESLMLPLKTHREEKLIETQTDSWQKELSLALHNQKSL